MTKQFIIDIQEVDAQPADWTTSNAWPGNGFYIVKGQAHSLYQVHDSGVNFIYPAEAFTAQAFKNPGESVSESLLLKAIAAASRAEVLK